MFRLFLKYVIGGRTGKRESAVMGWLVWLAATLWLGYADFQFPDADLTLSQTLWTTTTPFVWAWLGGAFGFEWAASQSKWAPVISAISSGRADKDSDFGPAPRSRGARQDLPDTPEPKHK